MIPKVEGKASLIKEVNKNKIINLLVKKTDLTKIEISKILGMSIPTVTTNINNLKAEGLVEELESDIYTGGRKPKIIKLNPDKKISFGVNFSEDKLEIVGINLNKNVLIEKELQVNIDSFENLLSIINSKINSVLEHRKMCKEDVIGIGVSVPGIINKKKNKIEYTNMGISNVDLSHYEGILEFDAFYENEANVSLLAQNNLGSYEKYENCVYLSMNEGLGGAVIINNSIYRGSNGRAGEFGHLRFFKDNKETIEKYLSTKSIIQIYNNYNNSENISTFKEFEIKVKSKEVEALEVMENVIKILSDFIYNIMLLFDPDTIIIGGKFNNIIRLFDEEIKNSIEKEENLEYEQSAKICYANEKVRAVLGAAILPLENYLKLNIYDLEEE